MVGRFLWRGTGLKDCLLTLVKRGCHSHSGHDANHLTLSETIFGCDPLDDAAQDMAFAEIDVQGVAVLAVQTDAPCAE